MVRHINSGRYYKGPISGSMGHKKDDYTVVWYHPSNDRLWIRLPHSADYYGAEKSMIDLSAFNLSKPQDLGVVKMVYPQSFPGLEVCLNLWWDVEFESTRSEWVWITAEGEFLWQLGVKFD